MSTPGLNEKAIKGFIHSAGVIFLFVATGLFLVNVTSQPDLAPPNDPIFQIPVPVLFWIVGVVCLAMSAGCLFLKDTMLQVGLIVFLAIGYLGARLGLALLDISNGFTGYLGPLANAFGIQAGTADALLIVASFYLLSGCLWFRLTDKRQTANRELAN